MGSRVTGSTTSDGVPGISGGAAPASTTRTARATRTTLPLPGSGDTAARFLALWDGCRADVSEGRLAEADHDADAILAEIGDGRRVGDGEFAEHAGFLARPDGGGDGGVAAQLHRRRHGVPWGQRTVEDGAGAGSPLAQHQRGGGQLGGGDPVLLATLGRSARRPRMIRRDDDDQVVVGDDGAVEILARQRRFHEPDVAGSREHLVEDSIRVAHPQPDLGAGVEAPVGRQPAGHEVFGDGQARGDP